MKRLLLLSLLLFSGAAFAQSAPKITATMDDQTGYCCTNSANCATKGNGDYGTYGDPIACDGSNTNSWGNPYPQNGSCATSEDLGGYGYKMCTSGMVSFWRVVFDSYHNEVPASAQPLSPDGSGPCVGTDCNAITANQWSKILSGGAVTGSGPTNWTVTGGLKQLWGDVVENEVVWVPSNLLTGGNTGYFLVHYHGFLVTPVTGGVPHNIAVSRTPDPSQPTGWNTFNLFQTVANDINGDQTPEIGVKNGIVAVAALNGVNNDGTSIIWAWLWNTTPNISQLNSPTLFGSGPNNIGIAYPGQAPVFFNKATQGGTINAAPSYTIHGASNFDSTVALTNPLKFITTCDQQYIAATACQNTTYTNHITANMITPNAGGTAATFSKSDVSTGHTINPGGAHCWKYATTTAVPNQAGGTDSIYPGMIHSRGSNSSRPYILEEDASNNVYVQQNGGCNGETWPTISSVAAHVGSTTDYTGTFANGGSNALVGRTLAFAGCTNGLNNGSFWVTASSTTIVTVANASGVSEPSSTCSVTDPHTKFFWLMKVNYTDPTPGHAVFTDYNQGTGPQGAFGGGPSNTVDYGWPHSHIDAFGNVVWTASANSTTSFLHDVVFYLPSGSSIIAGPFDLNSPTATTTITSGGSGCGGGNCSQITFSAPETSNFQQTGVIIGNPQLPATYTGTLNFEDLNGVALSCNKAGVSPPSAVNNTTNAGTQVFGCLTAGKTGMRVRASTGFSGSVAVTLQENYGSSRNSAACLGGGIGQDNVGVFGSSAYSPANRLNILVDNAVGQTNAKCSYQMQQVSFCLHCASGAGSIVLSPPNPTISKPGTQQFHSVVTYLDGSSDTDGSTGGVVTWSSSNPSVATIDSSGLATTGTVAGSTVITQTVNGVVSTPTNLITSGAPNLLTITVSCLPATANLGSTTTCTPVCHYSDASTDGCPGSAGSWLWVANTPTVASCTQVNDAVCTGIALGTTTVTLTYLSISGTSPTFTVVQPYYFPAHQ